MVLFFIIKFTERIRNDRFFVSNCIFLLGDNLGQLSGIKASQSSSDIVCINSSQKTPQPKESFGRESLHSLHRVIKKLFIEPPNMLITGPRTILGRQIGEAGEN